MPDGSAESVERTEEEAQEARGLSRRNALKAGVAAGVGIAAWSGASITSLGSTPAYAASSTQQGPIDIAGGCRNTTQGCEEFGYQPLEPVLPSGFMLSNNVGNNVCCGEAPGPAILSWTIPNLTCTITVAFSGPQCTGASRGTLVTCGEGGAEGGSANINFACIPGNPDPGENTFYTITANCVPEGTCPG